MRIKLFNTLGRELQDFVPLEDKEAKIYTCGPTVYNFAHIGNLRTYVSNDVLRRVLEYAGYTVRHVMNITDVGHLTDDADEGEDKMVKSSREQGKSVWDIARYYTEAFFADTDALNIQRPHTAPKATEHIDDMIALIQRIEENGHTYESGGNVYFSIDTFPEYGKLALLDRQELQSGARIEVDSNKRNPRDFVLWFTRGKFENQAMIWDSPWGRGYPGWHIECSAMSMRYLGEQFDIHTGGVDHIPVHHTNEIAQSEGATDKKWVNYWVHHEFLVMKTGKMAKSKGNFVTLRTLTGEGYEPLDYRYFCLGGHYRSQLQFSFDGLEAARKARRNLTDKVVELREKAGELPAADETGDAARAYLQQFREDISDDLHVPRALSTLWKLVKDETIEPAERLAVIYDMDQVFGLKLSQVSAAGQELDEHEQQMISEREEARARRDFARADELRDALAERGVEIKDTPEGTIWKKRV